MHISIEWSDLSSDKQEEVLELVHAKLHKSAKESGKQLQYKDWHEPRPKSWQEAYCRYNAINSIMWEDYEGNRTNEKIDSSAWVDWLDEYLRDQAEELAYKALKNNEAVITI